MKTEQAIKKVQIAIDKMIDLENEGYGCNNTIRILDRLRELESTIGLNPL